MGFPYRMVWRGRNDDQVCKYKFIPSIPDVRNSILLVSGHQDLLAWYAGNLTLNDKPAQIGGFIWCVVATGPCTPALPQTW